MVLALVAVVAAVGLAVLWQPASMAAGDAVASWGAAVVSSLLGRFDVAPRLVDVAALVAATLAPGLLTVAASVAARAAGAARLVIAGAAGVLAVYGFVAGAPAGSVLLLVVVLVGVVLAFVAARVALVAALAVSAFVSTGWLLLLWTSDRVAAGVLEVVGTGELDWWRWLAVAVAVLPLAAALRTVLKPAVPL